MLRNVTNLFKDKTELEKLLSMMANQPDSILEQTLTIFIDAHPGILLDSLTGRSAALQTLDDHSFLTMTMVLYLDGKYQGLRASHVATLESCRARIQRAVELNDAEGVTEDLNRYIDKLEASKHNSGRAVTCEWTYDRRFICRDDPISRPYPNHCDDVFNAPIPGSVTWAYPQDIEAIFPGYNAIRGWGWKSCLVAQLPSGRGIMVPGDRVALDERKMPLYIIPGEDNSHG